MKNHGLPVKYSVAISRRIIALLALVAGMLGFLATTQRSYGNDIMLYFTNSNSSYDPSSLWLTFVSSDSMSLNDGPLTSGSNPLSATTLMSGTTITDYITQSYQLSSLSSGVDISYANSMAVYVSTASMTTGTNWIAPSFTNTGAVNSSFPSNTAEITYQSGTVAGDQSDVTAVNQWSIPLQLQTYSTRTPSPSSVIQTNSAYIGTSPFSQLQAMATANAANALNASSFTWGLTTSSGTTLSSPSAGGFPGPTANPNVIGPAPALGNPYANYIASNTISTVLSGTYANASTGTGVYSFTVTATTAPSWASGTGNGILLSGSTGWGSTTLSTGTTFSIYLASDSFVGTGSASYGLSAALLLSAYEGDNTIYYAVNGVSVTGTAGSAPTTFWSDAGNKLIIDQVFHDFSAGMDYGLVGNNTVLPSDLLTYLSGLSVTGTTWNEIGSQGWTDLENLVNSGTFSGTLPDLFTLTDGSGNNLFDEWAAILYANNPNLYGMPYSDYLQDPDIQSAEYVQGSSTTTVQSMQLTILPNTGAVPEPSESALLSLGVLSLIGFFLYKRIRQREDASRQPRS